MDKKYDVAIIGAGPGGYVAAIRAAQLGASVALIEKDKVGGTCLNRGCIPTKALLACVGLYSQFQKAENFGITASNITIDLNKVIERKNKIIEKLVKGVEFLLQKNKIDLIHGEGKIREPGIIEITNSEGQKSDVRCQKTILALGSSPASLPGLDFDHKQFLSSDDILNLTEIPQKLDIIGGGVIGIHFAYMFASLGTEVTVFEALPEILTGIDNEIVALAKRILSRKNIKFVTGTRFSKDQSCGKTLICVGRRLNGEKIQVNDKMETNIKDVYAIGDLVSIKQFAHVASEQGIIAAENAMGANKIFNYDCVPYTIYTNPEIASVGLNEVQAREKYSDIKIGKFPLGALGIAQALGEIEGFAKIISDKNNNILGAHIIGAEANTIIGAAVVAIKNKLTVDQLAETIEAHPSFPEGLQEAALSALGRSIHSWQGA